MMEWQISDRCQNCFEDNQIWLKHSKLKGRIQNAEWGEFDWNWNQLVVIFQKVNDVY
jgi:hypothetical protein